MIPPTIYVTGDEEKALGIISQAKSELRVLLETMKRGPLAGSEEGLFQATRTRQNILGLGETIRCEVKGQHRTLHIHVPTPEELEKEKERKRTSTECWCSCCFSEAEVTRVLGSYGYGGFYSLPYPPAYILEDLGILLYTGIRYQVRACQKVIDHEGVSTASRPEFIVLASDWAEYDKGEKVILLFMGRWFWPEYQELSAHQIDPSCWSCVQGCLPGACQANWPPGRVFGHPSYTKPDGTFVIVPAVVAEVNDAAAA